MTATIRPPYVPPLRTRFAGTVGGRTYVTDDQYGSTGLAVGGGTRTHMGGVIPDVRVIWPDWPEEHKSLGLPTTDHSSGATGGYLHVGNVDRDPSAWTDLQTVRSEISTAIGESNLASLTNPAIAHPTALDKGEFFAMWIGQDGLIYVAGNSQAVGGSNINQGQWISRINQDWSITYLGLMGFRGGHNDHAHLGYVQPAEWNGRLVATQLRSQAPGVEGQLSWAYTDQYWQPEPAPLCFRDLVMFGEDYNDVELARHGPIVGMDDRPWQLAAMRDVTTAGGATNPSPVLLAPLSDDLRRVNGMPLLIAANGQTGLSDAVSAGNASPTVVERSDGSLAIFRTGEDAAGVRTPHVTILRAATFEDRTNPAPAVRVARPAVAVQAGLGTLPNLFLPSGELQAPAASDPFALFPRLDFATLDSPPDDFVFVDRSDSDAAFTPTLRSITTDRGGLSMATSTNEDLFAQFGPTIAVNEIALLSVTLTDVRFADDDGVRFQMGFAQGISGTGYALEFYNDTAEPAGSIDNRTRVFHYTGSAMESVQTVTAIAPFTAGQTNRRKKFDRLTLSLVRYWSQNGSLKWILIAHRYDQPIGVCEIGTIGSYDVRPYWRLTGFRSQSAEVTVGAVECHAAWRQTISSD